MAEKVNVEELELSQILGGGAGGEVRKATWKDKEIAVKVSSHADESLKKSAEREFTHLTQIEHENVIKIYGVASDGQNTYLLMEYMKEGSLHDFLYTDKNREFSMEQALRWAYQCAKALAHLHSRDPPVVHRDVKPENMLLDDQLEKLKICDFGIATDGANNRSDMRGTPRYMAPEAFKYRQYTVKSDVYSFGVMLWEMMTRQLPYSHLENYNKFAILNALAKGKPLPMDALRPDCWEGIKMLIKNCLDHDPERRPTSQKIEEYLGELCVTRNSKLLPPVEVQLKCWEGIKHLFECYMDEDPEKRPTNEQIKEYLGRLCEPTNYEDFIQILDDNTVVVVAFHKDGDGDLHDMHVDIFPHEGNHVRMHFPIQDTKNRNLGKVIEREVRRAEKDTEREVSRAAHHAEREVRRAIQHAGRETERAAQDVARETERVAKQVGRESERVAKQVGRESERVAKQVGRESERVAKQVGREAERAIKKLRKLRF
ncbi:putative mitogen-activated protein kinase kinase kinase 7-like [Drosophila ficusphila]|uniref:putative mitogen-activated protein kinase kinase kinase 7-like n=1 Tax=Drosophila ficusphila TaxID=30025 RepID=UPI0007E7B2C6|nr:putative mitogen-activated protein kinase kinase kinase 7-like [Drosophila ficusphila]